MLLGMDGDFALADLRLVVTGKLLVLTLVHVPPELAVEFRAHPPDVAGLPDAAGDVNAKRGVVDRQSPADRFHAGELRDAGIRHHAERGEGGLGNAIEYLAVILAANG